MCWLNEFDYYYRPNFLLNIYFSNMVTNIQFETSQNVHKTCAFNCYQMNQEINTSI
jgi:hypothetical protein